MSKQHSQYKKYSRGKVQLGSSVYRGEIITTHFERRQNEPGRKWYNHKGLGTPSLKSLLDSIDYKLSGAGRVSDYLREQPIGSFFHVSGEWFVKTNFQGEHENAGNWYCNIETGRIAYYGTLAAAHVGYAPRLR